MFWAFIEIKIFVKIYYIIHIVYYYYNIHNSFYKFTVDFQYLNIVNEIVILIFQCSSFDSV